MSQDVIKQLKTLKAAAVKPNKSWVEKNRAILLSQIKNTIPEKVSTPVSSKFVAWLSIFMPENFIISVVRPVALLLIVALVAPTLYYGTVMASEDALPGEGLYPAKRVAEKIQVTVVSIIGDSKSETELHVELAKKRAEETKKIVSDPSKASNVASTMADLKNEIKTINSKLEQNEISANVAKGIKSNTERINSVLQDAKNNLLTAPSDSNKALADEVKATKDLVQEVEVKAVEVLVNKHLEGDTSVTKEDVRAAINSSVLKTVATVEESKQSIDNYKTILEIAKSEVGVLASSVSASGTTATATKNFNEKITSVIDQTQQASLQTDAARQETALKASEVNQLLSTDNFVTAIDRIKELSLVSKEVENLSDSANVQTSPMIPIVAEVKESIISSTSSASSSPTSSPGSTTNTTSSIPTGTPPGTTTSSSAPKVTTSSS